MEDLLDRVADQTGHRPSALSIALDLYPSRLDPSVSNRGEAVR